jgi:hypothetical protein
MRDERNPAAPALDPRNEDVRTDGGNRGPIARFVARFTWARLLLFAVSLLSALIVLQELIALTVSWHYGVSHECDDRGTHARLARTS